MKQRVVGLSDRGRGLDWQRTAAGLDAFGAFLIGKISIAAAALPIFVIGALVHVDSFFTLQLYVLPIAGALASAGMVAGLIACRRVPDPPDARTGFTGAALLIAACIAGDVYLVAARVVDPLAAAISALAHLVAYVAFLRSVARVGERLGEEELIGRARALGWFAIGGVGSATIGGYLVLRDVSDGAGFAIWLAAPIVVAGVAFAALLPCAMLSRQLARLLRQRFAGPPRAQARIHSRGGDGDTLA